MAQIEVETLRLAVRHQQPEVRDEASPTGSVQVEQGEGRALLLVPDRLDTSRLYPLITVLHGAGRQDDVFAKMFAGEANARDALFLIPRSVHPSWDLIVGAGRPDMDFLEYAYDLIYRRYPIDPARQALLGYSDGASYGLSLGLSNPKIFDTVMGWAAGFKLIEEPPAGSPKPRVLLEYGTHDQLFPFEQIALPMRADLERQGYEVDFMVDKGGRHWPRGDFHSDALDWYFTGALPDDI
jgi:phospholipase/carboxylesterase